MFGEDMVRGDGVLFFFGYFEGCFGVLIGSYKRIDKKKRDDKYKELEWDKEGWKFFI